MPYSHHENSLRQAHWMTAKIDDGRCRECDEDMEVGDRIVYDPIIRKAYCKSCGDELIGADPEAESSKPSEVRKVIKARQLESELPELKDLERLQAAWKVYNGTWYSSPSVDKWLAEQLQDKKNELIRAAKRSKEANKTKTKKGNA